MDRITTTDDRTVDAPIATDSLLYRLTPRAGIRAQLFAAASVWLVGASILMVRGLGYLRGQSWWALLIAAAVVIGVLKSRYLLDGVARKAVLRIQERGRGCFFGFFSWRSWGFVVLMMGGGILLRNAGVPQWTLAVVYLGVGTALLVAERIFWRAALERPVPAVDDGNV
jgi:hypothetical protein